MKKIILTYFAAFISLFGIRANAQWVTFPAQTSHPPIQNMYFINDNTGFASDHFEKVWRTTDGGIQWDTINVRLNHGFWGLYSFHFNEEDGQQVGYAFTTQRWLVKTTDVGKSWFFVADLTTIPAGVIAFSKYKNTIIGVGYTTIAISEDNGEHWRRITPPVENFWSHIIHRGINAWYLCSGNTTLGKIWRSPDGNNWRSINLPFEVSNLEVINDRFFCLIGTHWSIDRPVKIVRSMDEWKTYDITIIPEKGRVSKIKFINNEVGYLMGYDTYNMINFCYKTTDGGDTWFKYLAPENGMVSSFWPTTQNLHVCTLINGYEYLFWRLETTGILNNHFNSRSFTLSQNYPNPFNPETRINFQIPTRSLVSLTVFDITGREVTTLVSQSLEAGIYEYSFNASALISGVYFYTIQAGDFIETKKMILIK